MANYEVRFCKSVAKDLRTIPNLYVTKILKRIQDLAIDPRPPGCEKLSGQERYRVRQGGYRILYEIKDQHLVVIVVKVAHRREAYR